jgi:hypothetical protein
VRTCAHISTCLQTICVAYRAYMCPNLCAFTPANYPHCLPSLYVSLYVSSYVSLYVSLYVYLYACKLSAFSAVLICLLICVVRVSSYVCTRMLPLSTLLAVPVCLFICLSVSFPLHLLQCVRFLLPSAPSLLPDLSLFYAHPQGVAPLPPLVVVKHVNDNICPYLRFHVRLQTICVACRA